MKKQLTTLTVQRGNDLPMQHNGSSMAYYIGTGCWPISIHHGYEFVQRIGTTQKEKERDEEEKDSRLDSSQQQQQLARHSKVWTKHCLTCRAQCP